MEYYRYESGSAEEPLRSGPSSFALLPRYEEQCWAASRGIDTLGHGKQQAKLQEILSEWPDGLVLALHRRQVPWPPRASIDVGQVRLR